MMEGAGVRICRTLGTSELRNLDPFLMLDELRMPATEATAGFPDHPHRFAASAGHKPPRFSDWNGQRR